MATRSEARARRDAVVDQTVVVRGATEAHAPFSTVSGVTHRRMDVWNKALVLAGGVVAWVVVAATAILIVFNLGTKNQVLMFLPILAVVVAAWLIGELVTQRVFNGHEKGV
jgi:hypothetical protein